MSPGPPERTDPFHSLKKGFPEGFPGIAYDADFQDGSSVSPLLPANLAWRFGAGLENQLTQTFKWGFAAEYMYGGTLDTNLQSTLPVAVGQRGDLVGSYDNIGTLFFSVYLNWTF